MKRPGPRLGWEITVTRRGLGPFDDPRWKSHSLGSVPSQPQAYLDGPQLIPGSVPRPRHSPWPSTVIWRWRWELGLVIGTLFLLWAGWRTTGAWLLVIAPIVVSALTLIQPCLRLLLRQGSAIAVQHRIRTGCAQAGLHGPDGELPAVLWTRLLPDGERICLWSPPGLTVNAFRAERDQLAEACRSRSVRIEGHSKFTRIVILDVVRRGSSPVTGAELAPARPTPVRTAATGPAQPDHARTGSAPPGSALAGIPRPRQRQEA
jgi:hypothetical protein